MKAARMRLASIPNRADRPPATPPPMRSVALRRSGPRVPVPLATTPDAVSAPGRGPTSGSTEVEATAEEEAGVGVGRRRRRVQVPDPTRARRSPASPEPGAPAAAVRRTRWDRPIRRVRGYIDDPMRTTGQPRVRAPRVRAWSGYSSGSFPIPPWRGILDDRHMDDITRRPDR